MLLTLLCAFMKYPCDYKLNVFQVSGILSVALAALYPLTLNEIYYSVNSLNVHTFVPWEEFLQRFRVSSDHHQSFQLFFFFFLFLWVNDLVLFNYFFMTNRLCPNLWSNVWTILTCSSIHHSENG